MTEREHLARAYDDLSDAIAAVDHAIHDLEGIHVPVSGLNEDRVTLADHRSAVWTLLLNAIRRESA